MKKNFLFISLIVVLCMSFVYYEKAMCNDYRDAFTGNYFCKKTHRYLNNDKTEITSVSDTLTINVSKAEQDSILKVVLRTETLELKLYPNHSFSGYHTALYIYGKFFSSDSVALNQLRIGVPEGSNYNGKKN